MLQRIKSIKSFPSKAKRKLWRLSYALSVVMVIHWMGHNLLWAFRTPYARSDWGKDQLCSAAYSGRLEDMKFLLESGADPDSVGWDDHLTPLGRAVWSKKIDAIRLLLEWGASPDARDDFKNKAIAYLSYDDEGVSDTTKNEIADLLSKTRQRN